LLWDCYGGCYMMEAPSPNREGERGADLMAPRRRRMRISSLASGRSPVGEERVGSAGRACGRVSARAGWSER
jgi:hypothetical protein